MTDSSPTDLPSAAQAYRQQNPDSALIVFSGEISDESVDSAIEALVASKTPKVTKLCLFLTTWGGDPHAAYRLCRFASGRFDVVRLLLAGHCKSAGTLVAVGANEIGFGRFGELGPLDVQMTKPDEIFLRHSGLDVMQAIAQVTSGAYNAFQEYFLALAGGGLPARTAAEIAANLATKLYEPVAAQIDPVRLGEADRAIRIAGEYGNRLDAGNLKPGALPTLIRDYPTHGFVIDRNEANQLFHRVTDLTDEETTIAEAFGARVRSPAHQPFVCDVLGAYPSQEDKGVDQNNESVNDNRGSVPEADSGEHGDREPATQSGDAESDGYAAETATRGGHSD